MISSVIWRSTNGSCREPWNRSKCKGAENLIVTGDPKFGSVAGTDVAMPCAGNHGAISCSALNALLPQEGP